MMPNRTCYLLAISLTPFLSSPAQAGDKPLKIDPAACYVLVQINNLANVMFKGTKVPGSLTLARYDTVKSDVRGGIKSPDTALPKGQNMRLVIASKPLLKTKTSRLYLVSVEPDTWVVEGSGSTSFSLGSYSFAIKPGEILDLGVITPSPDWDEGEGPQSLNAGSVFKMTMLGALMGGGMPRPKQLKIDWHKREKTDLAVPAELASSTVTPVNFTYGAKFGNYLGGLINRVDGRAGRGRGSLATDPAKPAPQ
jgi:hypothetical protein